MRRAKLGRSNYFPYSLRSCFMKLEMMAVEVFNSVEVDSMFNTVVNISTWRFNSPPSLNVPIRIRAFLGFYFFNSAFDGQRRLGFIELLHNDFRAGIEDDVSALE